MTKFDSSLDLVNKIVVCQRASVPADDVKTALWEMQNGLTPREARLLIRIVNLYWRLRCRRWISYYRHHKRDGR